MLEGKRLLVVDEDFLVALDIQRILEAAGAISPVFARTLAEAETLRDRWAEFDLALVHRRKDTNGLIEALLAAGVAVVLTTADVRVRAPDGAVLLERPFSETSLLAACDAALR